MASFLDRDKDGRVASFLDRDKDGRVTQRGKFVS